MLAVAVAVTAAVLVSLVALLLAVDAGFLAGDDQLLVDSVELGASSTVSCSPSRGSGE